MAPDELRLLMREIRALDYELHTTFRLIAKCELDSEQISAFMEASVRRDRMTSRVFECAADQRPQKAFAVSNDRRKGNRRHQSQSQPRTITAERGGGEIWRIDKIGGGSSPT
jgi:hypothetical protein